MITPYKLTKKREEFLPPLTTAIKTKIIDWGWEY
jgi:hypothetical protein